MPTRKIIRTETTMNEPEPQPGVEQIKPGELNFQEAESLKEYLDQFGGSEPFRVKVYKMNDAGIAEFCMVGGPSEVSDERIQSLFGGGTYSMKVFVNGVFQESVTTAIAQPPKKNGSDLSESSPELRMMRENNAFLQSLIIATLSKGGQSTPIGELATAMATLKGIAPEQKDPMDLILKGMDLAKSFSTAASPDWKTGIVDGLKDIGKTVLPVLAARQGNGQVQVMEAPQVASVSQEDMLKTGITYLKQQVLAGMPVDVVVNWISYNANQPQYQPFVGMVLNQDFETFMKIDPEIANEPYLSYFRTLHSGLREVFSQEHANEDVDDSGRNGGNVRDITSNAKAGKKSGK